MALLLHVPLNCIWNREIPESLWNNSVDDWSLDSYQLSSFLQVSDIHLDPAIPSNSEKLHYFRSQVVPAILPKAVLVTGDITNGKKDIKGRWLGRLLGQASTAREDQWIEYYAHTEVYHQENTSITWSDVRGNHDAFGVDDMLSSDDLFQRYAVEKQPSTGVSVHHFIEGNDNSSIKLIKFSPPFLHSLHRPLNFFARTCTEQLTSLMQAISEHNYSSAKEITLIYGHYPSSTIQVISEGFWRPFVRFFWKSNSIFANTFCSTSTRIIYLSGHLHTFLGWIPQMYCKCGNYLELELADLFTSSMYRWMAIDHGSFVFTDVVLKQQDIIALVTNPVSIYASTEESNRLSSISSHIRILIATMETFPDKSFIHGNIVIEIDENRIGIARKLTCLSSSHSFLFVCAWNPTAYAKGLHTLTVKYCHENDAHCVEITSMPFSLSSTKPFSFIKRLIRCSVLLGDIHVIIKGLCLIGLIIFGIQLHIPYLRLLHGLLPSHLIHCGRRFIQVDFVYWRFSQLIFYLFLFGPILIVFGVTENDCIGLFFLFYTRICGEREPCYLEVYNLMTQQLWCGCLACLFLRLSHLPPSKTLHKDEDSEMPIKWKRQQPWQQVSRRCSFYSLLRRYSLFDLCYLLLILFQLTVFMKYLGTYGLMSWLCSPALSLVFLYCLYSWVV